MLRTIAYCAAVLLLALLAVKGGGVAAQTVAPDTSTRAYFVTSAQAFPSLPLPLRSMVFRNGLYQSAGINYDVSAGTFRFRPGALSDGDRVAVVTIP
jgi:hypothetical protein